MIQSVARIRVAVAADSAAITAVLAASYTILLEGHYPAPVLAAALPLMTKANPALIASGTYYVAEVDDGRMATVGGWTWERPGSGDVIKGIAHLRHFGTHPAFTGRGIAGSLVRHCLQAAKSLGAARIQCESTVPAERFYERCGLRSIETIDVALAPGIALPSIRMAADL
jgi:GNAT superfamily N-acetyltransferase